MVTRTYPSQVALALLSFPCWAPQVGVCFGIKDLMSFGTRGLRIKNPEKNWMAHDNMRHFSADAGQKGTYRDPLEGRLESKGENRWSERMTQDTERHGVPE